MSKKKKDILEIEVQNNFRMVRKAMGMNQKEFARYLGFSESTISEWKKGESYPSALSLKDISHSTGVSIDFLLGDSYNNVLDLSWLDHDQLEVILRLYFYFWDQKFKK